MKVQRRIIKGAYDTEKDNHVIFLDRKRHNIHTQLFDIGKELGMDKADVLMNILSYKENLAEYGLPEIPVQFNDDRSALEFIFGADPIGEKEKWGIEDEKAEEEFQKQLETNLKKAQTLASKYNLLFFLRHHQYLPEAFQE